MGCGASSPTIVSPDPHGNGNSSPNLNEKSADGGAAPEKAGGTRERMNSSTSSAPDHAAHYFSKCDSASDVGNMGKDEIGGKLHLSVIIGELASLASLVSLASQPAHPYRVQAEFANMSRHF